MPFEKLILLPYFYSTFSFRIVGNHREEELEEKKMKEQSWRERGREGKVECGT